ncbi:putative MFS family arabinose efflux permease [Actinocorallia herbida]|uniref:Putative MFS family arabinose efflux permease n=1 Tax=Actinocorallia herbida TaxID=58109 RepID=A0A3N1D5N0_9ACTN|nr:MFS transporter [Actinocorallia herbida]ROO88853.1 putative MFS family arabinose efflux permease [Actinocorallia herbida]
MRAYVAVLGTAGAWRFLLPGICARLPQAMLQIGTLLLVEWATGSYGWGGLAAAFAAVAQAVAAPQTGRLADRYGQRAVLVPQVLVHAVALGALLVAAQTGLPPVWLVPLSGLAGATMPQVGSMVRARWAHLLPRGRTSTAFAVEAVTDDLMFTLAPVVLLAVATAASPVWALTGALVLVIAGTLVFAAVRTGRPEPAPAAVSGGTRVLAMRGVAVVAGALLGVGTVFGALQVAITSYTAQIGDPGAAGTIYGTFSAGSLLGGLAFGALRLRGAAPGRLAVLLGALAVALLLPPLASSTGPLYAAAGAAGLVVAPALITGYTVLDGLVPAHVKTEGYTWLTGGTGLGIAAGAALGGQLADRFGPSTAFLLPPVTVGLAAVLVVCRRAHLAARPADPAETGPETVGLDHSTKSLMNRR